MVYPFLLLASALWFGAAFRYFSFQQHAFAKVLIPKPARNSPIFLTTAALARFLGGMNGSLALFALTLLALWFSDAALFSDPLERGLLLIFFSAAHFSQFIFNVPVLMGGERKGDAYWPVLSGPMRFIFVMDALQTLINLLAGTFLVFS